MQFNIPTLLTLFRVILIPFFVLVFYLPVTWSPFAAALIFCVAALIWVEYAGIALFFVAAVLTLWSMLQYLSAARADLLDQ